MHPPRFYASRACDRGLQRISGIGWKIKQKGQDKKDAKNTFSMIKKNTIQVMVGNIAVGGGAPVVIQSMTNTDSSNREATVSQILDLWKAGSEIVRITVNDEASASQVPDIKKASF